MTTLLLNKEIFGGRYIHNIVWGLHAQRRIIKFLADGGGVMMMRRSIFIAIFKLKIMIFRNVQGFGDLDVV